MRAQWERKGYSVEEVAPDDPQTVFYALDTQSLFGDGRFVVVRAGASDVEKFIDRLVAWAESPPPAVAAAFVMGRAAKLVKALGARADVIDVESPKPWETPDWLVRFVKGKGRAMSKDAAVALVDAIGSDLRELATAADQLATATGGAIGVDTVHRMFRGLESQLWTFLDAVLRRDRSGALKHLNALMRSGEHPLVMHSALAKQFRALAAVKDVARATPATLAKELDLSVGYVNRAQKNSRSFDPGEIRRAFRLLADADLALKGGERGDETPGELVLELLVGEICGDRPVPMPAGRRR